MSGQWRIWWVMTVCLGSAGMGAGWSLVEVIAENNCSATPWVTVLLRGKPVTGAQIQIFRVEAYPKQREKLPFVGVTNSAGRTRLPRLKTGHYSVEISYGANDFASLNISHLPRDPQQVDKLTAELQHINTPEENALEIAASAVAEPAEQTVQMLSGTVYDQTGAIVPRAVIEVVGLDAERRSVQMLTSGQAGTFSAGLPEGEYGVQVSAPGFKPATIRVRVDGSAHGGEVRVVLKVGAATT